ncbi:hypothetical protein LHYA1_G001605 [Lachnellula hyalina]|uniref:Uncharacterized protein n=1 Tax=Lachnellula hyalina TaxID=1316788 RepID=A0A8H8R842_9HELO|nr:uncharacterized protein LHYA1_G001605 [Lachnellula hyalina]TVY30300.1 hypothetical protein LHYA1_G001605 [Lachnellula hyalina]
MAEQNIPRKGISEPSYTVHRSSNSDAGPSTSIPNQEPHDDHDRSNTPPPYSGPTTPSMSAPRAPPPQNITHPGLPHLDYRLYAPSTFLLSADKSEIKSYETRLSTYPNALVSLIQSVATVPPKPHVRIVGKSSDGTVDFDVTMNAMNLIVPDADRKGKMNYVRIIGPGETGFRGDTKETLAPDLGNLDNWARSYCADTSAIKHTAYRGHCTVSFPLTHSRVVIHSPDKVNRFFSSVTKVFTGTKKYEVIKSIWPYADVPRGETGRRCAVQEEEVWFNDWKDAIRHAVLGRRRGWVTGEDRLEFLMEPRPAEQGNPSGWGGTHRV